MIIRDRNYIPEEQACFGLELRAATESAHVLERVKLFHAKLRRAGLSYLIEQEINVLLFKPNGTIVDNLKDLSLVVTAGERPESLQQIHA